VKSIKVAFWGLLLGVTGIWLLSDTLLPEPATFFPIRTVWVQYTGVVAITAMSIAMVLATRPRSIEYPLGGLDKMYRLHKWLGIAALIVAVIHWLWAQGAKWALGWGWLTRPQQRSGPPAEAFGAVERFFRQQRGLAETIGEWAFYAAVVLIVLTLVQRFPYRLFVKTHKWLAVVYLALVFHAVVLMKFEYWTEPIGLLIALLLVAGTISALIVLLGRVGARRQVQGHCESLTYYPELRVLETEIALQPGWQGHKAGQFAFVTSDEAEGAHPYTIASASDDQIQRIVFVTKDLGDYTSRLHERLKVGVAVKVEGPYGCFTFDDQTSRQIWIGAGIGITPFIARMKHLARMPDHQDRIDLFHPTRDFSQAAIDKLTADAKAANVHLHLLVDGRDGRLDGEQIRTVLPDWKNASIWFCGPPLFGQSLRKDLVAHGLAPTRFHQELFQMR
jgi:predicted ferric reductase